MKTKNTFSPKSTLKSHHMLFLKKGRLDVNLKLPNELQFASL